MQRNDPKSVFFVCVRGPVSLIKIIRKDEVLVVNLFQSFACISSGHIPAVYFTSTIDSHHHQHILSLSIDLSLAAFSQADNTLAASMEWMFLHLSQRIARRLKYSERENQLGLPKIKHSSILLFPAHYIS
ncbi:hypothetical protein I3760_05G195100 [Carya illinoinensis]|nr:hypothetical protein I3760_05G195100 [Carya illinoinensis]